MLITSNVSLGYGGRKLFDNVNITFTHGNCYGLIGANGAGKSTFLQILSGDLEPNTGEVIITPGERLAVLRQDHFAFDQCEVLTTVIMGHTRLYSIMEEKEGLYAKENFTDADGIRSSELEGEFAELNGWDAEYEAAVLLSGLGIPESLHQKKMHELKGTEKVKVLLAQALFGHPNILILDEPTNHLDIKSIVWLVNFLHNFEGIVIVVSHDRHFLNQVCTHIADIDFGKIQIFVGNYDFWYESSQLIQQMSRDKNKRMEEKANDLKEFIKRFSANASKSKQATSRKKQLEKLTLEDIQPSSRKYPFVGFKPEREAGNDLLTVDSLSKTLNGKKVLDNISFTVSKSDKIAFVGQDETAKTTLFRILMGELDADSGTYKWGVTTSQSYFPKDNSHYFNDVELNLIDWLRQYSTDLTETFIRSILGRMLFSGEEALKEVSVLSGGEKVRLIFTRMMLSSANVLILDEPTNHLDLESITAVNNGLISFSGTVLFSSHDHQFIQTIANRIIEITPNGLIDMQLTYDEYLEKMSS